MPDTPPHASPVVPRAGLATNFASVAHSEDRLSWTHFAEFATNSSGRGQSVSGFIAAFENDLAVDISSAASTRIRSALGLGHTRRGHPCSPHHHFEGIRPLKVTGAQNTGPMITSRAIPPTPPTPGVIPSSSPAPFPIISGEYRAHTGFFYIVHYPHRTSSVFHNQVGVP